MAQRYHSAMMDLVWIWKTSSLDDRTSDSEGGSDDTSVWDSECDESLDSEEEREI